MTTTSISTMSDRELLERTMRIASDARHLTAELLALIGECDTASSGADARAQCRGRQSHGSGAVSSAPAAGGGRQVAPSNDPRAHVAALAADRYLLRVTLSAEAHSRLRRAQELMGHCVPDGNPAAIIDRALSLLVDHLERVKLARVRQPRNGVVRSSPSESGSRHIPAAMRRRVWARDEGRCAFVGSLGRCTETRRLEFHHIVPFARGGPTSAENLALRCRGHNGYESAQAFGRQ